ncbi:hypothetical protein [Deinococcus ruber]|nr:hypothetical protein [Deinococcus ruber]
MKARVVIVAVQPGQPGSSDFSLSLLHFTYRLSSRSADLIGEV